MSLSPLPVRYHSDRSFSSFPADGGGKGIGETETLFAMSDHVVQPNPDLEGIARQSMHDFQAAWMSRWKHKSCKPSALAGNHLPLSGLKDNLTDNEQQVGIRVPEKETNATKFTQGLLEFSEDGRVDTMEKSVGKPNLDSQLFQVSTASRNPEGALGRSNAAPPEGEGSHLKPKGFLWDHKQLAKSNDFVEKNSIAISPSFQLNVGSSSKCVPHGFSSKGIQMRSFMCEQEETDQSCPVVSSKEHFTDAKFCSFSTFWIREKKTDTVPGSEKLETSFSRRRDSSPWLNGTSASHSQLPTFLNTQSQKGQGDCSRGYLQEGIQSVKAYHDYHSVPRNEETVRIQTSTDSMEEFPRRTTKFSQTTNEFLITKKTGVNLSSLGQVFRDSNAPFQLKRKGNGFLSLSPGFSFQDQQEGKLQSLWCSSDSERRENGSNVRKSTVCLKNESSAETDAMELDPFQKSQLYGALLCPPNQKIEGIQYSSTSPSVAASAGEESVERITETNTKLPDMNEEPLAVPVVATVANDREPSPSRTLSLGSEHLLSHAEQHSSSKSTAFLDGPQGAEPSSRWVKRLRLSNSGSLALGTKVSTIGEAPRDKVDKIFKQLLDHSATSSEPTESKCHSKQQIAADPTLMLLKKTDSSSDSVRKGHDISLSHSWIQRFNGKTASPKEKPVTVALCESLSSKATVDEIQKKQFPSIAAMALMGKALTGFSPCEFRRSGSLMVWNT